MRKKIRAILGGVGAFFGVRRPQMSAANGQLPRVLGVTSFPVVTGLGETGRDIVLDLADAWHTAIQGMTRSGKSVLMYVLLVGLSAFDAVWIVGLDPTGVLLGPHRGAPGDEFRAIQTKSMEEHAGVITRLVAEMDRRIAALLGAGADKVTEFSRDFPLMVVVIEEYPGLLAAATAEDQLRGRKPADRVAPRIQAGVRRLIQEGAKVGFRVVLLAQRMDAGIVGGAERSNLGNRITLRVDSADAVRMLHPNSAAQWSERVSRFAPGHALIDRPGAPTVRFRVDYLGYEEYVSRLRGRGGKEGE